MAILVHEIWIDPDEQGQTNQQCLRAGPDGDAARSLMGDKRQLLTTFEAGSYLEAMTIYFEYFGRGPYTAKYEWDAKPYPEEDAERQRAAGVSFKEKPRKR